MNLNIRRSNDGADANLAAADGAPMPRALRGGLMVYLLALALTLIYLLIKLYSIEFPDPALVVEGPASDPDITALSKGAGPVIFHAFPYVKAPLTPSGTATHELVLYGDRFSPGAKVRLNGQTFPAASMLDDNMIRVVPPASVFEGVGVVNVEVLTTTSQPSNTATLRVARPRMPLRAFTLEWPITREIQLLLMVLIAGALGSFVHALKSLADFIGNRTAVSSWAWWYLTRPCLGATMALIFYAVLRGGFLTGTPADVRVVNPFGAIAVAALVGMFADNAAQKLAEIFETLFKAEDRRSGRLAAPVIDKLEPSTVRAGGKAPLDVKISGDHLGKVTAVKVNSAERAPEKVEERQVTFKLEPADFDRVGQIRISVVSPDGASPTATLRASDLQITKTALAAGTVGTPYADNLTAAGGKPTLKWKIAGAPAGLDMDGDGHITGTPTSAGKSSPTVTVTDADGATDARKFDVTIA